MATLQIYDLNESTLVWAANCCCLGLVHVGLVLSCIGLEISYGCNGIFTCLPGTADHKFKESVQLEGPPVLAEKLASVCRALVKRGWAAGNYSIQRGYCCVTFVSALSAELQLTGLPWHTTFGADLAWTVGLPFAAVSRSPGAMSQSSSGGGAQMDHPEFNLNDVCMAVSEPAPEPTVRHLKRRSPDPEHGAPTAKMGRHGIVGRRWSVASRVPQADLLQLRHELYTRKLWTNHYKMPANLTHVTHKEVQERFGVSEKVARTLIQAALAL